jgi:hypothetical protein
MDNDNDFISTISARLQAVLEKINQVEIQNGNTLLSLGEEAIGIMEEFNPHEFPLIYAFKNDAVRKVDLTLTQDVTRLEQFKENDASFWKEDTFDSAKNQLLEDIGLFKKRLDLMLDES